MVGYEEFISEPNCVKEDIIGAIKMNVEKPPIGLMPKRMWQEQRLNDLNDAIDRYEKAKCEVPVEWLYERNELVLILS